MTVPIFRTRICRRVVGHQHSCRRQLTWNLDQEKRKDDDDQIMKNKQGQKTSTASYCETRRLVHLSVLSALTALKLWHCAAIKLNFKLKENVIAWLKLVMIIFSWLNLFFHFFHSRTFMYTLGGCIAQWKHSCFPPSIPGFESRLSWDFFSLLLSLWTELRSHLSRAKQYISQMKLAVTSRAKYYKKHLFTLAFCSLVIIFTKFVQCFSQMNNWMKLLIVKTCQLHYNYIYNEARLIKNRTSLVSS